MQFTTIQVIVCNFQKHLAYYVLLNRNTNNKKISANLSIVSLLCRNHNGTSTNCSRRHFKELQNSYVLSLLFACVSIEAICEGKLSVYIVCSVALILSSEYGHKLFLVKW